MHIHNITSAKERAWERDWHTRIVSLSSFFIFFQMHAYKSHSFSTRCVRTACFQLLTSLGNKLLSSNCNKVDEATTDSQQVVSPSLILSARTNLLQKSCISLVWTTCSKSVAVINLVTRTITTCSRLVIILIFYIYVGCSLFIKAVLPYGVQ
jgi:hypothetical protein